MAGSRGDGDVGEMVDSLGSIMMSPVPWIAWIAFHAVWWAGAELGIW